MLVAALLVSLAGAEAAAWYGHHPLRPSFPFSEPQHPKNPSFPFPEQQQNQPVFDYGRAAPGPFLQEEIRVEQDAGNFYISPDEEQVHISRSANEEPSKDYNGWTVLKLEGIGRSHVAPFHSLHDLHEREDVSVLHENRVEGFAHVATAPNIRDALITELMQRGLRVTDLNTDIGRLIENNKSSFRAKLPKGRATYDSFMNYQEIMAFVDRMERENPNLVKKSVIGKSVEGRDIIMLTITSSDKSNRLGREMGDSETLQLLSKLAQKNAEEKHAAALRQQEAIRRIAFGKNSSELSSPQADPTKGSETYDLISGFETAKSNDEVKARNSINEIVEDNTRHSAIEMTIKALRNLITNNRDGRQISAVRSELPRGMGGISQHGLAMLQEIESRSSDNLNQIMTLLQSLISNSTVSFKSTAPKPIIFIDGGIHAREWVSPASLVYFVEQLATNAKNRGLLQAVEWRLIPVLNPDGYIYSWTNDRLWRKNRANNAFFRACRGVDLNRNFGYKWGGAGTSASSCSQIFRGPREFSEPESTALKNAITKVQDRVKAYITVHSYGQMILHPWGYDTLRHPDHLQLTSFGNEMAEAINKVHGQAFKVGSAAGVLYAAAGGSDDYVSSLGVPYSYTFELRDKGKYGFELDNSLIRATVEETWAAIEVLGNKIKTDYFLRSDSNNFSQRKVDEESDISEKNETNTTTRKNSAIPIMIRNDNTSQDKVKSILNNLASVLASDSLPDVGNGSQVYLLPPTHYIMFGKLGEKPSHANDIVRATGNLSDTESNQVHHKLSTDTESNQVHHKFSTANESVTTTDLTTLKASTTPYSKTTTTESTTTSRDISVVLTDLIRSIHGVGNVSVKAGNLTLKPMDIGDVIRPSGLVEGDNATVIIDELVRPSGLVEPSQTFNPSDFIRPALFGHFTSQD